MVRNKNIVLVFVAMYVFLKEIDGKSKDLLVMQLCDSGDIYV